MSFLSKMKPKYFQVLLGYRIGPQSKERSRGGGLMLLLDLKK